MRKTLMLAALAGALALPASAEATTRGKVGGAVVGGVAGAAVAGPVGALVGGVGGAVVGNEVTNRQRARRRHR